MNGPVAMVAAPAAPHPSGYPDAHLHDTGSQEWRDICFARWICRRSGPGRAEYIERLRARHGAILAEHFGALARAQWAQRRTWVVMAAAAEPDLFAAPPVAPLPSGGMTRTRAGTLEPDLFA